MFKLFLSTALLLGFAHSSAAATVATVATFRIGSGVLKLELFDEDKPVTVSNFVRYVTSGRYENQIIHRWVPGFVIQGGGYRLNTSPLQLTTVDTFGTITNEYSVGRTFSNTYGTIAMARLSGQTNSATSQWYINLGDNSELDRVDGGFTVFGRVISGTNLLNVFIPPAGTFGVYTSNNVIPGSPVPVLTTNTAGLNDLVYVDVSLERDLGLEITRFRGERVISWNSFPGLTNTLEFTTNLQAGAWTVQTNLSGDGARKQVTDRSNDPSRTYRVKIGY